MNKFEGGSEKRFSSIKEIFSVIESGDYKKLLELKAYGQLDVNCKDDKGLTPLMVAVDNGKIDMVNALKMWGAKVNAIDNKGQSVLDHAIAKSDSGMIMTLKIFGAR